MRLWSLHPKYLDAKGLVALWREALLAKNVLEGKTKGYKNHPQLIRFKKTKRPVEAINQYLAGVYLESVNRNYNFDKQKLNWDFKESKLPVTRGQLDYEVKHLLNKLKVRDTGKFIELSLVATFEINPLFELVDGEIEKWEIITVAKPST
jgi:DUF4097 and DUF4098 domain-containing protein YvlB